jgi:hypothetical protein
MLVYPQLRTGAVSHYPIVKRRRKRTVVNTLANGRSWKFADDAAEVTVWRLEYAGLSDEELAELQAFFISVEGRLRSFSFLDPTANLLAWSAALDHDVWERDPLLSLTPGSLDPAVGTAAWKLSNRGLARQAIRQTLTAPGAYVYCLSAYCRADGASTLDLCIGSLSKTFNAGSEWKRVTVSGRGEPTADCVTFAVGVEANVEIEVRGIQVEAQPSPSEYKQSIGAGIYSDARFYNDSFAFTSTAPNQHSCAVEIINVNNIRD